MRDADRPFVTEPRPARRRRVAVGATVLTAAAALLAVALLRPAPTTTPRVSTEPGAVFDSSGATPFSQLPAYEGASFADQLQAEHVGLAGSIRTDTVTYTALPDVDGRFTTVRSGTREVIPPPACPCKKATVWLVGGQAAFGWGQRDQADHRSPTRVWMRPPTAMRWR